MIRKTVSRLSKLVLSLRMELIQERNWRKYYESEAREAAKKPGTSPTLKAIRELTPRPDVHPGVRVACRSLGEGPIEWLSEVVKARQLYVDSEHAMAWLYEFLDRLETSALSHPIECRYLRALCGRSWELVFQQLTEGADPDMHSWRALAVFFAMEDETTERLLWWLWDRAHEETRDLELRAAVGV